MNYLHSIGEYFLMLKGTFHRMTKGSVLRGLILKELDDLIIGSMGIVAFLSFLIMAGKVGSYITSSIGSMNVTEQIDALEVMGINSLNYLIFPKIIAMLFYPFVIAISMFLGVFGAYAAAVFGGFVPPDQFVQGLQEDFIPFHLVYAFIKTFLFAFILATVPAYHGYYMKGGALEVGEASTTSFVWTSVVIIITNYAVTQLLLS